MVRHANEPQQAEEDEHASPAMSQVPPPWFRRTQRLSWQTRSLLSQMSPLLQQT